ncbi:uncharacterized protein LOC131250633 [Magnolia sinica]|uniref:uncharacterized protein LOC131250633 n=1 Tax=Magnolia sinica TaxID=86752 RepID=UPI00265B1F3B|nr:uncharacterized protein LOC131250633 [Magnolia sinica]
MKPEWALKIHDEVIKQYNAGFLVVSNNIEWLANIIPVPKKDEKVRMCIDFRDHNKASPKDDFPLPHIDTLIDNTADTRSFPSWTASQAITRSRWPLKIERRLLSSLHEKLSAIGLCPSG